MDIELAIKLPEELYEAYKGRPPMLGDTGMDMIVQSIANGTPLPEHHGRLIDADRVKNTLDIYVINEYNGQFIRRSDIDTIPTIIEGSDSE